MYLHNVSLQSCDSVPPPFLAKMIVLALLALNLATVLAVNPTVPLGYSTYQGTPYANGITEWLGLRYAAPPTGDLRFAAPRDPYTVDGVTLANQVCIDDVALIFSYKREHLPLQCSPASSPLTRVHS